MLFRSGQPEGGGRLGVEEEVGDQGEAAGQRKGRPAGNGEAAGRGEKGGAGRARVKGSRPEGPEGWRARAGGGEERCVWEQRGSSWEAGRAWAGDAGEERKVRGKKERREREEKRKRKGKRKERKKKKGRGKREKEEVEGPFRKTQKTEEGGCKKAGGRKTKLPGQD